MVHKPDGSVRIYCKGASEWILKDCTHFSSPTSQEMPMTAEKRLALDRHINGKYVFLSALLCQHDHTHSPYIILYHISSSYPIILSSLLPRPLSS
ncbi:hypothetical protein EON65_28920 [archaeon]|nr:MAG: hypothetical protein EON65_28920 [archaeon]